MLNKSINKPELYLLTNDDEFALLYAKLEQALATGAVSLLQIRRKKLLSQYAKPSDGQAQLYAEASQLIQLANRHAVSVIINDDINLAKKLGVGVHLGQDDGSVRVARQQLGTEAIIGRTCYQQLELVKTAHKNGANYAAMGAVFNSTTKPTAKRLSTTELPIEQITSACQQDIDICLIGGLTVDNAKLLKGLPISYIAVVADIMSRPTQQIAKRCEQWQQLLDNWLSKNES